MIPLNELDLPRKVPHHFDWRKRDVVGPVQNQLDSKCNSSYAISATSAVESAWAIAGNSF